jgi:hypothetical protein
VNATAERIITVLAAHDGRMTQTAAALGISKQAYKRGNLSDDLCVRACALLGIGIDPALARLHRDNATIPEARAVWEGILVIRFLHAFGFSPDNIR